MPSRHALPNVGGLSQTCKIDKKRLFEQKWARCPFCSTKIRKNFLDWTTKKTQAYEIRRVFFSFKTQSFKFINRFAIYTLFSCRADNIRPYHIILLCVVRGLLTIFPAFFTVGRILLGHQYMLLKLLRFQVF